MNIWQRLELEQTDDKRLIKRAYAKQLKQCKPDEKPEEFQALHDAYQQALSLAESSSKSLQEQTESTAPQDDICDNNQDDTQQQIALIEEQLEDNLEESISIDLDSVKEESNNTAYAVEDFIANQTKFNQYLDEFCTYIQEQGEYPEDKSWEAFLGASFLDDPKQKQTTGYHIFDVSISLCTKEIKKNQADSDDEAVYELRPTIDEDLLLALNERFAWLDQRIELEDIFDLNAVDYLLDLVVQCQEQAAKNKQVEKLSIKPEHQQSSTLIFKIKRFIAFFIIDAGIILFLSELLYKAVNKHDFPYLMLGLYILYFSVLESNLFNLSASIGKNLMGLKVAKVNSLSPLPIYQAIWRSILTLPLIGLFKITAFITIFMSKRQFLNDSFSGSCVVETNSSLMARLFKNHH